MALDSLGTIIPAGPDKIAGKTIAEGFIEATLLTDENGDQINAANPMPVADAAQLEATQEIAFETLRLLAAMLNRMPRLDAQDRLLVSQAEVNPTVALATSQTLAAVTQLTALGSNNALTNAMPMHAGRAGTMHIYNQLKFS